MSKKVLVISTSFRKKSNSHELAEAFARGAKDAGHEVEVLRLIGREINYCVGCGSCHSTGQCIMEDDGNIIADKMKAADVICFATPIYFYEMAGQMKTMLDRTVPVFYQEYAFRDIYLLATAADDGPGVIDGAVKGLEGWVACYEKAELAGTLLAGGVTDIGEIQGHPGLDRAYDMGRKV